MEFQAVLESRRSMRAFDPQRQVTPALIREMVAAAMLAPSWKNSQTARYYCLTDPEKCDAFRAACLPASNAQKSAHAALVVTTFVSGCAGFQQSTGLPDNECGDGWGYYDLGLHNQNFILKAKELGLDTLIMGLRDATRIRTMLSIPEEETIVAVIAVGYPAQEPIRPPRKDIDEILKFF